MLFHIRASFQKFAELVGYNGVQMKAINTDESIKSSNNGYTYVRYDSKFGLHGDVSK